MTKNISLKIPQKTISSEIVFSSTFKEAFQKLEKTLKGKPFLFVSDTNIEPFLEKALKETSFEVSAKNKCIIDAGEKHKTMESVQKILKACFEARLDRDAILVAVGGGVIGDITGFAASLFLRGVSVIQMPTSLLAMVDASIGGKTGINTEYGKNLVGTLNQPAEIHVCYEWLTDLPEAEIKNGMCEMIKHGILGQKKHFKDFE
ncbi:UNVERIFIED_CONTAM: hypothetical protein GTU68_014794, partial [Idotea baltica]|nr:hypothetical protein [Idotea baltica]